MKHLLIILTLSAALMACQHVPAGWGTMDMSPDDQARMTAAIDVATTALRTATSGTDWNCVRASALAGVMALDASVGGPLTISARGLLAAQTAIKFARTVYHVSDLAGLNRRVLALPETLTEAESLMAPILAARAIQHARPVAPVRMGNRAIPVPPPTPHVENSP